MSLIRFTRHAQTTMEIRGIAQEWVERTIGTPDWTEPDPTQPGAVRAFRSIQEHGARVLRVVHDVGPARRRVITAFFDRRARRSS